MGLQNVQTNTVATLMTLYMYMQAAEVELCMCITCVCDWWYRYTSSSFRGILWYFDLCT